MSVHEHRHILCVCARPAHTATCNPTLCAPDLASHQSDLGTECLDVHFKISCFGQCDAIQGCPMTLCRGMSLWNRHAEENLASRSTIPGGSTPFSSPPSHGLEEAEGSTANSVHSMGSPGVGQKVIRHSSAPATPQDEAQGAGDTTLFRSAPVGPSRTGTSGRVTMRCQVWDSCDNWVSAWTADSNTLR